MRPKVVVVEANEVPLRIFEQFARSRPTSTISRLLKEGSIGATLADDVPEDSLYPSQTWASFNTGRPYSEHRIHWYNDPKRFDDFYWHRAAKSGLAVVLVNTLHSSPLHSYAHEGNYRYVIPDCFATDANTLPADVSPFQKLNLNLTLSNGRRANLATVGSAVGAFLKRPIPSKWGLDASSGMDVAKCICTALNGKRERIRNAQFPLLASLFVKSVKTHNPDLALLFTNHVAANQHRYWYASFPSDFQEELYPAKWANHYRREIMVAMELLDRWLTKIVALCLSTDRMLVIASSMGQGPNRALTKKSVLAGRNAYRVADPSRLAAVLFPSTCSFEGAMVPQYTFSFPDELSAQAGGARAAMVLRSEIGLSGSVDVMSNKVTVTVQPTSDQIVINSEKYTQRDLGFVKFNVDDHHSGRHQPLGSLIAFNDKAGVFNSWQGRATTYLEYARTMADYFRIDEFTRPVRRRTSPTA